MSDYQVLSGSKGHAKIEVRDTRYGKKGPGEKGAIDALNQKGA